MSMEREKLDTSEDEEDGSGTISNSLNAYFEMTRYTHSGKFDNLLRH